MLEDRFAQHDKESPDKYIDPGVSVEMTTLDYVVRPQVTVASTIIVLPSVSEAKGRFYSIVVRELGQGLTIIITDRDDSECWADIVLNSKCDALLLYSDGLFWHRLAEISTTFPSGYDYP